MLNTYTKTVEEQRIVHPETGQTLEVSDDSSSWRGDRLMANTVNFMRQTFWYIEFCSAVAEGDIGRVFEIIKVQSLTTTIHYHN